MASGTTINLALADFFPATDSCVSSVGKFVAWIDESDETDCDTDIPSDDEDNSSQSSSASSDTDSDLEFSGSQTELLYQRACSEYDDFVNIRLPRKAYYRALALLTSLLLHLAACRMLGADVHFASKAIASTANVTWKTFARVCAKLGNCARHFGLHSVPDHRFANSNAVLREYSDFVKSCKKRGKPAPFPRMIIRPPVAALP